MGLRIRRKGENTSIGQTNMQFQWLELRGDTMTEKQRQDALYEVLLIKLKGV